MKPRFSVLLAIYEKEYPEYCYLALESIVNQTVIPDEVVLVKDGPLTMELENVIEKYKHLYPDKFKVIALDKNQGLGKALQIGVVHCSYDIIARMDSDDIAVSDRFEKQLRVLTDNLDIDIVGSFIDEFDGEITNIISTRKVPLFTTEIYKGAKRKNPFNHMTVMFRKQAVLAAGNYQPFLWFEDYFLWVRMIINHAKMLNIPQSLVYARTGKQMLERRGGIKYLSSELKLQKEFRRIRFISLFDVGLNIFMRAVVRLLPNKIRGYIYISLLR